MSEMAKSAIYCGVALVAALVAYVNRPASVGVRPDEAIGKPLFPAFTDPLVTRSLEIVRYDEELGELRRFKVAEVGGVWVIPSHQNYPADAENRVRDAATSFVDLNVINIASDNAGDHATYGVVEPDAEKTRLGEEGVGLLVVMQDADGKNLAQVIIGKKVKGAEDQRFVRLPTQDRVYTVAFDPDKLSTRFEDWIEKDLLKLNTFDVDQIVLKDYSVQTGPTPDGRLAVVEYDQRLAMTLQDENGTWKLLDFQEFRDGKLVPSSLQEGEQLNRDRLNTLRDALKDLKIVDVARKPKNLGADLKADKGFLNDLEGTQSLIGRGFFPVPVSRDQVELLSSDGEVLIRSKDGVEYVLRFGQVAGVEEESDEGNLSRWLFVTARVDKGKFPPPQLEPLPEAPAENDAAQEKPPAAEKSAQTPVKPANGGNQAQASEEPRADQAAEGNEADANEPPAAGPEDPGDAKPTAAGERGNDADTDRAATNDTADPPSQETAESEETPPPDREAERERIVKENQRKLDEHKDKLKKAEDKVQELNYRFADWYYVISEDVFKKIHLGRADIIQETEEARKEGFGVDAFRELEQRGLTPDGKDDDSTDP